MTTKTADPDVKIVDAKLKYRPGDTSVICLEFVDASGKYRSIVYQGKIVWAESKKEAD